MSAAGLATAVQEYTRTTRRADPDVKKVLARHGMELNDYALDDAALPSPCP